VKMGRPVLSLGSMRILLDSSRIFVFSMSSSADVESPHNYDTVYCKCVVIRLRPAIAPRFALQCLTSAEVALISLTTNVYHALYSMICYLLLAFRILHFLHTFECLHYMKSK